MTKRDAQKRVDQGDLTWGHLKQWLQEAVADGRDEGVSAVNAGLTKRQSIGILVAGTDPKDDNELVMSDRFTSQRNALNSMIAVNVLREVSRG